MPIHPHLDGVLLDVAYRGSAEPQTLDVGVKLAGPAEVPLAPWAIGSLVDCVARGLAGGSDFAPEVGRARLLAGPTGEGAAPAPGELGPDYAFRLEVAGMSPRFVRVLVEHLAASGHPHGARTLSVVGGLPTDGSPLSVREDLLARWLDDPAAYPGAWSDPGFRVVTRPIPRGATVRVALARGRMDDVAAELEATFSAWQSAVLTYPNARHTGRGVMDPHGSFARTRTELYAKVSLFDHAREPARASLVNALARFHRVVAPLASVEIATP
ncbi:MAG: hypothetical protein KF894_02180 [Labilithrix sp.]|nr:hypothetical protein [Labilithrix sp.]